MKLQSKIGMFQCRQCFCSSLIEQSVETTKTPIEGIRLNEIGEPIFELAPISSGTTEWALQCTQCGRAYTREEVTKYLMFIPQHILQDKTKEEIEKVKSQWWVSILQDKLQESVEDIDISGLCEEMSKYLVVDESRQLGHAAIGFSSPDGVDVCETIMQRLCRLFYNVVKLHSDVPVEHFVLFVAKPNYVWMSLFTDMMDMYTVYNALDRLVDIDISFSYRYHQQLFLSIRDPGTDTSTSDIIENVMEFIRGHAERASQNLIEKKKTDE